MIVCAAIQFQIKKNGRIATICGHRHGDCFSTMADLGLRYCEDYIEVCQGFLTSTGSFLDRYAAFQHAYDCGQLSATTRQTKLDNKESKLYSEDLY